MKKDGKIKCDYCDRRIRLNSCYTIINKPSGNFDFCLSCITKAIEPLTRVHILTGLAMKVIEIRKKRKANLETLLED